MPKTRVFNRIEFFAHTGKTYDGTPGGSQALTGEDAVFLSNLAEDPGESVNLRRKHPQVNELMTMARRWLEDVKKP